MKKIRGRLILLIIVAVVSVVISLPSFPSLYNPLPAWMKAILSDRGLALGLDLQGGVHLVLEVEENRAVEIAVDRAKKSLEDLMTDTELPIESVVREGSSTLLLTLSDEDDAKTKVTQEMEDGFPGFTLKDSSGTILTYELRSDEIDRIKNSAINQALETIRNRIDEFGVAEPLIQRLGRNQIAVQLPGVKDPERAKDLIKKTALLEFKMLDESKVALELPPQVEKGQEEQLRKEFEDRLPAGSEILFESIVSEDKKESFLLPYLIKKDTALTGDVLQDARVTIGRV